MLLPTDSIKIVPAAAPPAPAKPKEAADNGAQVSEKAAPKAAQKPTKEAPSLLRMRKDDDRVDLNPYIRIWAMLFVLLMIGTALFERWVWQTNAVPVPGTDGAPPQQDLGFCSILDGFWGLAAPYFEAKHGSHGNMYVMQLAFFLSLDLFNAWVNNNWRQQFWDCVQS